VAATAHRTVGRVAAVTLSAALAGLAAGCDLPGRPRESDRFVPPDQVLDFAGLYQRNCAACHGADGRLGPGPPLNDPLFLALVPDGELLRVVRDGRPGTLMPAFAQDKGGHLTAEQVGVLAEGIKKTWKPAVLPDDSPPPPLTAGAATGKWQEGIWAYERACASCHGDHGQGGMWGERPVGAVNNAAFLALNSDQVLRRYIITGRPDLDMPNYAETTNRPRDFKPLTSQEVTDLVALLDHWRKGRTARAKKE
jgi:mono/diheme cytochrome c family protein